MPRKPVWEMKASALYDALAAKMEKNGRTREELDEVFVRLCGISRGDLRGKIDSGAAYATLFPEKMTEAAAGMRGTVCGIRVHEIEDPLMRQIRAVDLAVDKLAKGRAMDDVLPPVHEDPAPVMVFDIDIDGRDISGFDSPDGAVTVIPFGGRTDSPLFSGEIRPGAADVQIQHPGEARILCARYLFTGRDGAGNACSLYVENIGRADGSPGPIRAKPTFITDSAPLSAFFRGKEFRSEVHGWEGGVRILIFEDKPLPDEKKKGD